MRRVAIVEDHGALRIFLRDTLTALGWNVTGVAGTAEAGAELVLDDRARRRRRRPAPRLRGRRRRADPPARRVGVEHQARRLHRHDGPDGAARRAQGRRRRHRAQGGRAARAARGPRRRHPRRALPEPEPRAAARTSSASRSASAVGVGASASASATSIADPLLDVLFADQERDRGRLRRRPLPHRPGARALGQPEDADHEAVDAAARADQLRPARQARG